MNVQNTSLNVGPNHRIVSFDRNIIQMERYLFIFFIEINV